jgi:branched-chain amino acid aminotransferase
VLVWINGRLASEEQARISPLDHGLLTGDGVFESIRVSNAKPFALGRHLRRLERSAEALGLPCPDPAALRAACAEVVEANRLTQARLRITMTAGSSPLTSERGCGPPTVVVAASSLAPRRPVADVVVVPWRRNEHGALAGVKTISYAENVRGLAYAQRLGADEAIFANTAGQLCEGSGTNVFVEHGRRLVTPPLSSGCLAGVTRELLLESGVAEEGELPLRALTLAGEAFLTSTTRIVQPVRAVDGTPLRAVPGPLTQRAARVMAELEGAGPEP